MSLEIVSDAGTQQVKDAVGRAVRGALGQRVESGSWRVMLRELPGGFIVDLTNLDGIMRQWVFDRDEPVEERIKRELEAGLRPFDPS